MVGHGIARANKKPIASLPRGPTNPKNWVFKVGNHRQFGLFRSFITINPFRSRSVSGGSFQFSKNTIIKVPGQTTLACSATKINRL